jgi:1-acyl-sn-glycerol-3-phosphate acyltransferase
LIAVLYLAFGVGAIVISLLVILPTVVFSKNREFRLKRVRNINRFAFRSFTNSGKALGLFDVSFVDASRLDRPGQLIIANHPSLLDVVFLIGCIPNVNCVVKKNLLMNPFLAIPVYFAEYILNDEGETLLKRCIACCRIYP